MFRRLEVRAPSAACMLVVISQLPLLLATSLASAQQAATDVATQVGAEPAAPAAPAHAESAAPAAHAAQAAPPVLNEPGAEAGSDALVPRAALPTAPASMEAQPIERARADRLEAALVEHAHVTRVRETFAGIGSVVISAVLITAGILVATDSSGWGRSEASAALTGIFFTTGAGSLAGAIGHWVGDTPAERRLGRWQGLSDAQRRQADIRGRFEGELQSEAEVTGALRVSAVPGSVGLVLGGGALIGAGASDAFHGDAQSTAFVIGGISAGIGALRLVSSLWTRTLAEKIWLRYQQGLLPDGASE